MSNRVLCYNKLWKKLIDKGMKKKDLCECASVSSTSLAKLKNNKNVNTDVLVRICNALNCDIEEIVEIIEIDGGIGND